MSSVTQCETFNVGSCLSSTFSTYQVRSFLGQGTYGKVAACTRRRDNMNVAIKLMTNEGVHVMHAKNEVLTLRKLRELDSDKSNIVRYYHSFVDRQHICLVFEQLDVSLKDFLGSRCPQRLLMKEIRPIVQQVANALDSLRTLGTIHGDLKLDNVMLVNHRAEPYRVKLIDFGFSSTSPGELGALIQALPYRSPEIMLGLPFTEAVDMWSLGCMAATMYIGTFLYPGRNEYEMMRYIVGAQGLPPDHLLDLGCRTNEFFNKFHGQKGSYWELKSPQEIKAQQKMEPRMTWLRSLDELIYYTRTINVENTADRQAEIADVLAFVSMLKPLLHMDAASRITPCQVLQHDFITMDHIAVPFSQSSLYVKSCFDLMGVCQKNLSPDSGTAVHRPIQQPTCMASHPATQAASHYNLAYGHPRSATGLLHQHQMEHIQHNTRTSRPTLTPPCRMSSSVSTWSQSISGSGFSQTGNPG